MIKSDFKNINDELFETIKNYLKNENDKNEISKEQFHIIGNEDMGNTFKSLTSFFIFIKKKIKSSILYLNAQKKEINEIIKENLCIVSDYEIKFK